MIFIKVLKISIVTILICALLCACSGYDLADIGVVSGVAFDKDNTITVSIIRPGGNQNFTSSGKDIPEALEKCADLIGRELYFGQNQIIIISREVAQLGIKDIINWAQSSMYARGSEEFIITQGDAAQALEISTLSAEEPSSALKAVIDVADKIGYTWKCTLQNVEKEEDSVYMPIGRIIQHNYEIISMAQYEDYSLAKVLSEDEARAIKWLNYKVEQDTFTVNAGENVVLNARNVKVKKGDKVKIDFQYTIELQSGKTSFKDEQNSYKLSSAAESYITKCMKKVLDCEVEVNASEKFEGLLPAPPQGLEQGGN